MPKTIHGLVTDGAGAPLAGVAVTNGCDVITTDGGGSFSLVPAGHFIAITRPTGWTTDRWFVRIDAGATEETAITFVLEREEQSLPYQFMHITDTHIDAKRESEWSFDYGRLTQASQLKEFLADLPQLSPASRSVVITGDLVDHGSPDEFVELMDAVSDAPVSVNLVPGNHDHMHTGLKGLVSRNNYIINDGNPELYEAMVGPRWFSYDVAGLHVVVMDWHTHELGLDHTAQEEWLRNDLAAAGENTPYILCMHDQPGHSIMDWLPRKPLATFSGHWHTSRVVEIDGVLHVNSPTPFFAGLDYSPPMFREVVWDGTEITLNSRTMPARYLHNPEHVFDVDKATIAGYTAKPEQPLVRWRHQLAGAGHRAGVALADGMVLAGSQIEDQPAGSVEALDAGTGHRLWSARTASAVKTRPLKVGVVVVAAEVNGAVAGLDAATGERRWTTPSADPYRRFAWQSPVESEGIVVLGDQSDLRALHAATGEVLWRRTDLSPHHNIVTHSSVLILGRTVVVGFWPTPNAPIAVDLHTGESLWTVPPLKDDPWETARKLRVTGTAVFDGADDSILLPAIAGTVKLDRASGRVLWTADHEGGYSPSTPVVTPDGYVVTVTGRGIRMLNRETGALLWDVAVDGLAPFPMTAYRKKAHPVMAAPLYLESEESLLLPGLDGVIRRYRLDGTPEGEFRIGVPLAAPLVAADGGYLTVGVDGGVLSLDLPSGPTAENGASS
ncbi:PQQ-binding-like beta-propeller repeat protein [Arthrobacter sp. Y81]|uniref:outer membrane protein assembly factor BamB family protein n=1 Tax=Arthrobacter sp. Y81 TaxID=2058897 RepID=UPI000CE37A9E|nr:PQQ-binding-like beta-propeller repeat protein [Arthrobacter sp. Y81]